MTTSNPLGRLIDATRELNGWSDEDVARHARRGGHQLVKSTISSIRTNGVKTVAPKQVRALAAGLDIPESEILRAALETVGLPVGAPGNSAEQAIRRDVTLPTATKDALLAILRDARKATPLHDAARDVGRRITSVAPRDNTQHAGVSGTARPPAPSQDDLDLAADTGNPARGQVQRQRDAQDRFQPDPEGPEGGA